MRTITVIIVCIMMLSIAGCAKKSATEQFQADMNKAGNQLNKDANNLFK